MYPYVTHNRSSALIFLLVGLLVACTQGLQQQVVPVSLGLNNINTLTVIDGSIENEGVARVQISYSNDIDATSGTPIRYEEKASITIRRSNGTSEALTYQGKGTYTGKTVVGKIGEIYTLTIAINEQTFTATATMLPPATYRQMTFTLKSGTKSGVSYSSYADEWIVNDPSATRNRYLFQWWTNGIHNARLDWAIDDDRVVNVKEGLRLFNSVVDANANELTLLRVAEIDKNTYDYFNMYEKIVRGLVNASEQTPYNPVSSFGPGTVGNFRAVAFTGVTVLTPPNLTANSQSSQVQLSFPRNKLFVRYNLYWGRSAGVGKASTVIRNINFTESSSGKEATPTGIFTHSALTSGTYYYRIEAEDAQGNVSQLSPEVSGVVK